MAQDAPTVTPTAQDTTTPIGGSALSPTSAGNSAGEIVVTGSRIGRRDYVSESPVVTVTSQALQVSGQQTLGESLNQLPQVSAGASSTSIGSGGRTTVDLRGLGSRRTLVLLDGKRLQPSDLFNSIDLNGIPTSLISGAEIITGGASAIYGSDALAGVVNFKIRKNFSGFEIDSQEGITNEGDGSNFSVSGTVGANLAEGRGNVVLSLSYFDRNAIEPQTSRSFFRNTLPSSQLPNGLIAPTVGNFVSGPAVAALFARYGATPAQYPQAFTTLSTNADGTLFVRENGGVNLKALPGVAYTLNGTTIGYRTSDYQTLSLPLKRYTAFGRGTYELTDHISAFAQFNYATFKTSSTAGGASIANDVPRVPASNPFIPPDLRALLNTRPNPNGSIFYVVTANALGFGGETHDTDLWQGQAGLSGDIPSLGWTWDAYFATGKTTERDTQKNLVSRSVFNTLINAPDGGASICAGGLNLFPLLNVSDACKSALLRSPTNYQQLRQQIGEANISGALLDLPGGKLRFATGLAYRRNAFTFTPDSLLLVDPSTGFVGVLGSAGKTAPASGATDVKEAYLELLVPVLTDQPLFKRLELDLAYRYSDYNTIGGVSTYKASLEWEPFNGLLLRGGYQRAIRAPSIGELYAPPSSASSAIGSIATGGGDPCSNNSAARLGANAAQVAALCVAQGIPTGLIASYNSPGQAVPSLISGNTNLKQETGDSYTLGMVVRPNFSSALLSRLSASVDFYDIKIKDAMGIIPGAAAVRACFNSAGENPTYSQSNFYCSLIRRESSTGNFVELTTPTVNLAQYHTRGIDAQIDYGLALEDLGFKGSPGSVALNVNVAYVDKYEIAALPGTPLVNFAGTIGNNSIGGLSHPHYKANASFTYTKGPFQLGTRARYIGPMRNSLNVNSALTLAGTNSITYFDAFTRFEVSKMLTFRAGISNVGNRRPPEFTGRGATDFATYDVIGRSFYVGGTISF